jgi:hypothetical protein
MSKAVTKKESNPLKKEFDNFFDSPTRGKLEMFLQNHFGEQSECDFKEDWQELKKMVKHLLAIANSGGGCVIVGMAQHNDGKLEAKGLNDFLDKANIIDTFKNYLPNSLLSNVEIYDYDYDDSEHSSLKEKKFQVVLIESKAELLPFVSSKAGDGFRQGAIYVRRGTSSVEANYEEVQKIINKRIETGYSSSPELDLQTHFDQLKFLYSLIESGKVVPKSLSKTFSAIGEALANIANNFEAIPNALYPKESIEEFVISLISKKKRKIEQELGVDGFSG